MNGHCACGSVRYRLKKPPLFTHACHCRWCQRESGSAFALNGLIEASAVTVDAGAVEEVATPSESGKGQLFYRCPDCKIALWSVYAGAGPKFLFVRMGTLDDPDAFPPDIHIYTDSKQPWFVLPQDVPAVPEYYRRSDYWPEESLARRQAVIDGT